MGPDATADSKKDQPPPAKGAQAGPQPIAASDGIREGLREDRPPAVGGVAETWLPEAWEGHKVYGLAALLLGFLRSFDLSLPRNHTHPFLAIQSALLQGRDVKTEREEKV